MNTWILLLWFAGYSFNNKPAGYAVNTAPVTAVEFTNKTKCEDALGAAKEKAYNIDGICVMK